LNGGAKKYAIPIEDVDYGDIVIFNWDWNNTTDHIGFATGPYDGYGFPTIEGNVGNAVKEKYRQLGNVAYVLRPPYKEGGSGSHDPSVPAEPKNNRDGGKLEVDGIGGWNTIIDWQNQLHVIEDGRISGQDKDNYEYFRGIVTVDFGFDGSGSKTVMTIQSIVGANVDGIWGKDTSTKIQEWLVNKGYPCTIDGYFGTNSVMALQQSLNDGMWKLY
jgi:peptidoglycan hydrolase-like protein with peptidoglycan-binding domain